MTSGVGKGLPNCFSWEGVKKCGGRIKKAATDGRPRGLAGALGGLTRSLTGIIGVFKEIPDTAQKGIAGTKFTAGISLPFDVWEVAQGIYALFKNEMPKYERNDTIIGVGQGIVEIVDGVGNILEAVSDIGAASGQVGAIGGALGLGASAAALAGTVFNGRTIYIDHKSKKSLRKAHKMGNDEVIKLASDKKRQYKLVRHGGVKIERYLNATAAIKGQAEISDDVKTARLDKAYKAVQKRITHEQIDQVLAIFIAVLGFTASVALFVSGANPVVIAGSVCLAALFTLCVVRMAHKYGSDLQFKNRIRKAQVLNLAAA